LQDATRWNTLLTVGDSTSVTVYVTSTTLNQQQLVIAYLTFTAGDDDHAFGWNEVRKYTYYESLAPLLEYTFCSPATSAPVERVFSQGGIFTRPHRARLGDNTLCDLMYSKCNKSFK